MTRKSNDCHRLTLGTKVVPADGDFYYVCSVSSQIAEINNCMVTIANKMWGPQWCAVDKLDTGGGGGYVRTIGV